MKIQPPYINRILAFKSKIKWWSYTRKFNILKRSIDIILVVPAIILLMPLFLIVALAIKLYDRGPVLFWQKRVGLKGREFSCPKFRSMCINAETIRKELLSTNEHGSEGVTFKMKRDPRITPVGRLIRRTSIDELPQLWSIVCGDMSLVGPRPPIPSEVARYSMRERQRLSVTPGLTCIWQVNGRSEIPFPQQVEMDIEYIKQKSISGDIKLIAKTVPAVIKGRGAY